MKKPKCLVVARANCINDGKSLKFQNMDGFYIDGIANNFSILTLLTPVIIAGENEIFSVHKNYNYEFRSPNIVIKNIKDYKKIKINLWNKLTKLPVQFFVVASEVFRHDVIFVMMSTVRAVFAAVVGKIMRKKVLLYSGNDWGNTMQTVFAEKSGKKHSETYIRFYSKLYSSFESIAVRFSDVRFLNTESSLKKYCSYSGETLRTQPLININPDNIFFREDTCTTGRVKILCVSSVLPIKGIEYQLKALKYLMDKKINCGLTVIGGINKEYFTKLQNIVRELNLQSHVSFTDYIPSGPELYGYFKESDIFILTSLSEGFPRVLYEAMTFSLPIVTSELPNIKDRIGNNAACYVKVADHVSIAEGIMKIITDRDYRINQIEMNMKYIQSVLNLSASDQFTIILNKYLRKKNG